MPLTKVPYSMLYSAPANAADFGLVGDGVADDTQAMQAFLNAACLIGAGVINEPKRIKITSPLVTVFGDNGVAIDFGGSTFLPTWTLTASQRVSTLVFEGGGTYRPNAVVSLRRFRVDGTNVPYYENTNASDLRGLSGVWVYYAGTVSIDEYEANDLFFGFGALIRFFNRSYITNVKFTNVGAKFNPTGDWTAEGDAAGDAVYLGDVIGKGVSVIDNIIASSYVSKYGRAGIVMEDLTNVTTEHVLHLRNGIFSRYQRTIHQEDRGKGRCVWEGGSAEGFSNGILNYGGIEKTCYFSVKNVTFNVNPPFAYGGTTGVQNFQNGGYSVLEGCQINYLSSVAERGPYVLRDCSVSLGSAAVTLVYSFRQQPFALYNCVIDATTGGYNTSNWQGFFAENCVFNGPASSVARPLQIIGNPLSGVYSPVLISNCRFNNSFCDFVNVTDRNQVQFSNNTFAFSGISTATVLGSGSNNTRITYTGCTFDAKNLWARIYGDGNVDSTFYACTFYNIQLQAINNGGATDKSDMFQAAACRFFYDDAYAPTAPIDTFSPFGGMQGCMFVDATTGQTIANPTNTGFFVTVGTGNLRVKSGGVTAI